MLVEIGEQNSFLVVRSTEDFVIVQIELVTHTKPDKIALSDWLFIELEVSIYQAQGPSPLTCDRTADTQSTLGGTH